MKMKPYKRYSIKPYFSNGKQAWSVMQSHIKLNSNLQRWLIN